MNNNNSRRLFIRNVSLASLGAAYLSSTSGLNAMTMEQCQFEGYNPYAETKTDLRASKLFGNHITIKGKVYDKNLVPRKNVRLEVWHLSPNSTKYRHQAKFFTNEVGGYSFVTDFPGRESGKMSRIYFRISTENSTYSTELLINDFGSYITGEHWEKNENLGDLLQPVKKQSNIQFNFSI